jgi:hypothetical protein
MPQSTDRVLLKLHPSTALHVAGARVWLEPMYDGAAVAGEGIALGAEARWYVADIPDRPAHPWDLVHSQLAGQLGIAEADIEFAEPDIAHHMYIADENPEAESFAIGARCAEIQQDGSNGKPVGGQDGWHLDEKFSQLGSARSSVSFSEPRTRVAHLDTGYYGKHSALPEHLMLDRERSFVPREAGNETAVDPYRNRKLVDHSGHGTGTLGILAGGRFAGLGGEYLGGAPGASILPLRIADSVVMLRTSSFAQALHYAVDEGVDVVTMSMGGLPSRFWREAVDRAYLSGVCVVAAAGNNVRSLPTRNLVYPARYRRVIAVCGAMHNGEPYVLTGNGMQGNFGPASVMDTAVAAYTPNIPWAVFGCPDLARMNGEGTSSATPQVAAAAALWYEKYKHVLPRDWRRVEAVRHALFSSAKKVHAREMGNGILRAMAALAVVPHLNRPQTPSDTDSFAFLRVLTGLGLREPTSRERMFNLELSQLWMISEELQQIVGDPDGTGQISEAKMKKLMSAVIEDERASLALRKHVAGRYPTVTGRPPRAADLPASVVPAAAPVCERLPAIPTPAHRRLRIYAIDPSLSGRLATAAMNEATLHVRWEPLTEPGLGEYLEIVDVDASGRSYDPVDLNDPRLLSRDGWAPSEGNPQFHQQMVYAVAMKTIEHFERALGRPVLWRPTPAASAPGGVKFVQRLTINPHALHQANAYYSPKIVGLLFGYFETAGDDQGDLVPGSRVYACLSHDIIAHETSHAILDGMYQRFNEPSNPDVLAFHEAFSDILALMQHFTMREVLESEIGRTRGNLQAESILGSLAVQFGQATGRGGALRDAIGTMKDGVWTRLVADPRELEQRQTPHARGAVLVAAVFDAFIAIYQTRTADLLRIYTGGTGVLPTGAIHPDLVGRLAREAATSATHVLTMCIRALDYLPPVDVTFFEYLRALITADFDLVRDDPYNYRVAFVEAFRRRGIYPVNIANATSDTPRTLSVDTLRWQGVDRSQLKPAEQAAIEKQYVAIIDGLKEFANDCFYVKDRETLFNTTVRHRERLGKQLRKALKATPEFALELGIDPAHPAEVHELRRAMRMTPDGRHVPQIIVSLTQALEVPADGQTGTPAYTFHGGSTLVVDLSIPDLKYRIVKNVQSTARRERTAAFVRDAADDPLRALFFAAGQDEPFALLHTLVEEGG